MLDLTIQLLAPSVEAILDTFGDSCLSCFYFVCFLLLAATFILDTREALGIHDKVHPPDPR